jgi:hypothetical protein
LSDIEPWLDSGVSADIAECLHAARRERPHDEVVERCAVIVAGGGLGLAAAAAAKGVPVAGGSSLAGVSSALSAAGLLKWGAGGLFAGTALMTSVHLATVPPAPDRPSAPAVSAPVEPRAELVVEPEPARPPVASEKSSPEPTANVVRAPVGAPPAASASPSSPDQLFAEELALVDRVRASVDANNPALASALLAQHERRFGKAAQLSPEARALRLEVLVSTGRVEEARTLAREILARDAAGPHAVRAREVLKEK